MSRSCSVGSNLALALLLAGCGGDPSAAEKKAADDRAVAQVQAVQKMKPPPQAIVPQPILFADIQKYNLFGAGCAFAPSGSMGAVLLTREKVAFLKLEDAVTRFASDPGSAKLPLGTVSRYVGKEFSATLTRVQNEGSELRFPVRLTVTDPFDQVVYSEDGELQCGA